MSVTAAANGKRAGSAEVHSSQYDEKRPRKLPLPAGVAPSPSPAIAPAPSRTLPPSLSQLPNLPLDACHNLIRALYHRDPTTADLIRNHLYAEGAKRRQAPVPEFGHLPDALSSALSRWRPKHTSKTDASYEVDDGIRGGLQVITLGCEVSDRYETRLSAFSTILDMLDIVIGVEDDEVLYEIMGISLLEEALMKIWEQAEERGESQKLRDDEEGLYQRVKDIREIARDRGDGFFDLLKDLAQRLSENEASTNENYEVEGDEEGSEDDDGYFEIVG